MSMKWSLAVRCFFWVAAAALSLVMVNPAQCDQAYDTAYVGSDVVQLTAEVLDGNQAYLYNTSQTVDSWHWFQITSNTSRGYFEDSGSATLKFGGTVVDAGLWSLRAEANPATDYASLSGSVNVPLGNTQVLAITDDTEALLAVTDTHYYTGGI